MAYAALIASWLGFALDVYWWIIIAEVIFSWIPRGPREARWLTEARRIVKAFADPYLGLFRRFIPVLGTGSVGIDLSPLVGLIVLSFIRQALPRLVFGLAGLGDTLGV